VILKFWYWPNLVKILPKFCHVLVKIGFEFGQICILSPFCSYSDLILSLEHDWQVGPFRWKPIGHALNCKPSGTSFYKPLPLGNFLRTVKNTISVLILLWLVTLATFISLTYMNNLTYAKRYGILKFIKIYRYRWVYIKISHITARKSLPA